MTEARPGPKVWGRDIPARNKDFTGREELLDRVREQIKSKAMAVLPTALHGMGGVGKTQIALEYAYRSRGDYDVVWWINSEQSDLVPAALARLAPYLELPSANESGVAETVEAVLDALRTGRPFTRWLLVFDNAAEPAEIMQLVPDGPGHVLITSRNFDWESVVPTLTVDVFSPGESRLFLHRRLPDLPDAQADALAGRLGHLPLALEQAGTVQAQTGMPSGQYLELLDSRATQLLAEGKPMEYAVPAAATWAVSVGILHGEHPEAVELLKLLAFFGPEPIPRAMLNAKPGTVEPPIAEVLSDPLRFGGAIAALRRYALIEVNLQHQSLQMHRLFQALLQEETTQNERERCRRSVRKLLSEAISDASPDDPADWPLFASLLPHVSKSGCIEAQEPHSRKFMLRMVRYLYRSNDLPTAEAVARRVLAAWGDSGETPLQDLCAIRRHLGNVLRNLGRYREAYELDRETLETARAELGPENIESLLLTNSYSTDLRAIGDFTGAFRVNSEAIPLHHEVLGRDNFTTLAIELDLGLDLTLRGEFDRAKEILRYVHGALRNLGRGAAHPSAQIVMNNLVRVIRLSGGYEEARELGEDVHALALSTLGVDHQRTMRAANDLAVAMRMSLGGADEAVAFAEERAQRYRQRVWQRHPDRAAAEILLSNAYREAGRVAEAVPLAESAIGELTRIYGDDHAYVHAANGDLALLRRLSGDPGAARALNERAVRRLTALLGRKSFLTLACVVSLAGDLAALGDRRAAVRLNETALADATDLLGAGHPLTLGCMFDLALDLAEDDEQRSASLRVAASDGMRARLGRSHPRLAVMEAGERLEYDFDPFPI